MAGNGYVNMEGLEKGLKETGVFLSQVRLGCGREARCVNGSRGDMEGLEKGLKEAGVFLSQVRKGRG